MTSEARTRTYEWHPVRSTPKDFAELSGIEQLRRVTSGDLPPPPITATLDYKITVLDHGFVVAEATPQEWTYNPLGTVHGGYAATLLDTVVACAVHSTLPPGVGYTTLELKLNFTRPLLASTGPIRAEGKVIHVGSRTATAEGRLVSAESGKLYAHATTTCLLLALGDKG